MPYQHMRVRDTRFLQWLLHITAQRIRDNSDRILFRFHSLHLSQHVNFFLLLLFYRWRLLRFYQPNLLRGGFYAIKVSSQPSDLNNHRDANSYRMTVCGMHKQQRRVQLNPIDCPFSDVKLDARHKVGVDYSTCKVTE